MGWVKVDDHLFDNPKILNVSNEAKLLYLAGLTHSAAHLTDGLLSDRAVRAKAGLLELPEPPKIAGELVREGLWEMAGGGYVVHDYLEYNPSAEQEQARRAAERERKDNWRRARDLSRANGHPEGQTASATAGQTTGPPQGQTAGQTASATEPRDASSRARARGRSPSRPVTPVRASDGTGDEEQSKTAQTGAPAARLGAQGAASPPAKPVPSGVSQAGAPDTIEAAEASRRAEVAAAAGCDLCDSHGWVIDGDAVRRCEHRKADPF